MATYSVDNNFWRDPSQWGTALLVLDDNNKQGFAKYSEAELTLTTTRDWTEEGVAEL